MMPEGLANNMTVQDFRDLIRYVMAHPFLTEVAVTGPIIATIDPVKLLADPHFKWSRPLVGSPGRIPLPANKSQAKSLVAAQVTAPGNLRTRLQLGSAHPLKVWLNGKVVYNGQPGSRPSQPDQAAIDVTLKEGVNQFLIQATYQGDGEAVYARLLDPDRKLTYPEPR
jgi:hypothetical protein